MRIASVSPRLVQPPRNGSSVRIFHLMRYLSERHEIRQHSQPRLAQVREDGFRRDVRVTDAYTEHRLTDPLSTRAAEWCYRRWISQPVPSGAVLSLTRPARLRADLRWADVCVVEFPWQFSFCRRERPGRPVVLVAHNVEVPTRRSSAEAAGIGPSASRWIRYVERLERHAVRAADLVVAVSGDDRDGLAARYGIDPAGIAVVPNGSDTGSFVPLAPEERPALRRSLGLPERRTVLFAAAIPKPADEAALAWVRRVAARLPELSFLVLGEIRPRPSLEGNVLATGFVDDAVPYFQAADVSLCPVEHGGGTKIKVWDSLAAGLPTVAFRETLRGTPLADGEHVLVAEKTEEALVAAVRRLVAAPGEASALGSAGRRLVVARHDWKTIAGTLEGALEELAAAPPVRTD